jgi:hypothetical protein
MSIAPRRRDKTAERLRQSKFSGFIGRYLGIVTIFAVLALVLALGWSGWAPTTWIDWLTVVGLTPAGVGGALLGDRFGQWLKDQGVGRQ